MSKLKYSEIAPFRNAMLRSQGGRCALCQLPCSEADACLDHDHQTGFVRGVLHRSCNALLGKVENNEKRYGIKSLTAFLHGAATYLQNHGLRTTGTLHPKHKTDEEKRLARNAKARKKRAATKRVKA